MILTHEKSFPSAKVLRDAICKELGWDKKHLLVSKNPDKITRLHLRYGNSMRVGVKDGVPNHPNLIHVCSDKKFFAKLLGKETQILTPEFNMLEAKLPSKDDFPFLIRETLHGSGAAGIIIFQEYEAFLHALADRKINYNSYWTPYFDFREEFRVHVLGGKIAKVFRKQLNEEDNQEDIFIRNNDNSHFFRLAVENTPENVVNLTQIFHKYVRANYGDMPYFVALDVGVTTQDKVVFIEANSAPGLNEATAEVYAKYLVSHCNAFSETEAEMKIAKELLDQTKAMKISWALQF